MLCIIIFIGIKLLNYIEFQLLGSFDNTKYDGSSNHFSELVSYFLCMFDYIKIVSKNTLPVKKQRTPNMNTHIYLSHPICHEQVLYKLQFYLTYCKVSAYYILNKSLFEVFFSKLEICFCPMKKQHIVAWTKNPISSTFVSFS